MLIQSVAFIYYRLQGRTWKTMKITSVKNAIQILLNISLEDLRHIFALSAMQILILKNLWQNIVLNKSNSLIGKAIK